ncbi:MAG: DNA polymerase IV [OM182 bacterium MED-G28]|uniref:DNA polymerase IV n=1 Tax=OM182 bacterium MED-G28 TaxID=1986256 RepID=A0A2A5W8R6_9GAMM|nr:MAG: DNA polymerase IV [OM182 bacterium MED-G28]
MKSHRKIIHCDCDCFYASIEMRDNPSLKGKSIAVGGSPQRRGVVATCNYEARKFGIHSAMASATARKRCPELIIIRPDMEKYRTASRQIHKIYQRYTELIEPLSLDEAYLDVSECEHFAGSATRIAEEIRGEVRRKIGITISAGIAPNKFLAKIASDWKKPDNQFVITPEQVEAFVAILPVKKLHGVGKVTANKMKRLGINTCGDLRKFEKEKLQKYFGNFGERLYQLSLGIDNRPIQTDRIRKSVSVENTYAEDLLDMNSCLKELPDLREQLSKRLENISPKYDINKQFIKIKFHNFAQTTVEMVSQSTDMNNFSSLCKEGFARGNKPVRLLGIGVRISPKELLSIKSEHPEQQNTIDQLSLIPEEL